MPRLPKLEFPLVDGDPGLVVCVVGLVMDAIRPHGRSAEQRAQNDAGEPTAGIDTGFAGAQAASTVRHAADLGS
jgi:hypothetical protein